MSAGSVIAGIASLGGSAASAGLAAREASKNRKFQKKMYQHRFQYSVKDMRKAGINPILAARGGLGGGGSPSGSQASMPDFGNAAGAAVSGFKAKSEDTQRSQANALSRRQMELLDVQIQGERARVGETNSKTQHNLAQTLLAINNKNRWQPFADAGAAMSSNMTGPARGFFDSLRTPNGQQNLRAMASYPYDFANKTAKDVAESIRKITAYGNRSKNK